MFTLIFWIIFSVVGGEKLDVVDVCTCQMDNGVLLCHLVKGTVIKMSSNCDSDKVRVTGPGYVAEVGAGLLGEMKSVVLEKCIMTCEDLDVTGPMDLLIVNDQKCRILTATTTKVTKEPKPRPPANPVEEPEDDDGDDDDDDGNYDDNTFTTSTSTSTTTTHTTVTAFSETSVHVSTRMITVTTVAAFREWWVIVGVGILICSCGLVCVIVKIRLARRARQQRPLQVPEVSSTGEEPQRTYVLRKVPRSPRRRRSDSMESVVLYAVGEEEL